MSLEQASAVAVQAKGIFPNLDVYPCKSGDGTYSVKVRDRCELILKIEDPNTDLEVYRC